MSLDAGEVHENTIYYNISEY